jgi:hypothetical protein
MSVNIPLLCWRPLHVTQQAAENTVIVSPRSNTSDCWTGKVKLKLSLCLTKHYTFKTYGGSGCIDPRFLDLGTSWRWVVSFTLLPFYPWGNSLRYPWHRRLGGPQIRYGQYVQCHFLTFQGLEIRPFRVVCSQSLYQLRKITAWYVLRMSQDGFLAFKPQTGATDFKYEEPHSRNKPKGVGWLMRVAWGSPT